MKNWNIVFVFIVIVGIFSFGMRGGAWAQTSAPKIFLTWRAESYAPPGFQGKLLPTARSLITVSLEVVDGGKAANLSNQTVYWYLNDALSQGGVGIQRITFRAPDIVGGPIEVRVELPRYPSGELLKTIDIPTVQPEAVIEAPLSGNQFFSSRIQIVGHPYFFNVREARTLNFSWRVNHEPVETTENPEVLEVHLAQGTPQGTQFTVVLTVENIANLLEKATRSLSLVFTE